MTTKVKSSVFDSQTAITSSNLTAPSGGAQVFGSWTLGSGASFNASTVNNGVYTNGSYNNPSWITALSSAKVSGLSTVATSGAYSDLSGKPSLATVATSGAYSDLSGKPSLFSGSYTDLTNKPAFATVATSGAYSDLSGKPSLSAVATSGAYSDLSGKPTIPSTVSSLSQDTVLYSNWQSVGNSVFGGGAVAGYTYTNIYVGAVDNLFTINVPSTGWWQISNYLIYYSGSRYIASVYGGGGINYVLISLEYNNGSAWIPIMGTTWALNTVNNFPADGQTYRAYSYATSSYVMGGSQSNQLPPMYITSGNNLRVRVTWSDNQVSGTDISSSAYFLENNHPRFNVISNPGAKAGATFTTAPTSGSNGYVYLGGGVDFSAHRVG